MPVHVSNVEVVKKNSLLHNMYKRNDGVKESSINELKEWESNRELQFDAWSDAIAPFTDILHENFEKGTYMNEAFIHFLK